MPVKRIDELGDTLHYKGSKSDGPPSKSKHLHEYIVPVTMVRIQRFDGSVSDEKYQIHLKPYCVECGKIRRRASTYKDALLVEVTPPAFKRLRDIQKV